MTAVTPFAPEETRAAILEALPAETAGFGRAPEPAYLYVPARHVQALSLDHGLVVGIRGAGKSAWWAALQSAQHRSVITEWWHQAVAGWLLGPTPAIPAIVRAGFGEAPQPDGYPDKRVLRALLEQRFESVDIWRTVMAWHSWQADSPLRSFASWPERVAWVVGHPSETAHAFKHRDDLLNSSGDKCLILFDALDRTADDWPTLRKLLRGLLQMLLEFRGYSAIRGKAFVRPDMLDDPHVTSFPDASKITTNRVELRWNRADLYGLLYQRLGNARQFGAAFRRGCEEMRSGPWTESGEVWLLPPPLREDGGLQRAVFHKIAGDWMGTDHRRGFPYTWLPNHLADAAGQVSPRSFLAAVREAAQESRVHGEPALHYEAIKRGVQEASRIRVAEVKDDFSWVPVLMDPLAGLVIPCDFEDVEQRWGGHGTIERVASTVVDHGQLPKHLEEGAVGLRRDLMELGVFSEMPDGRVNMPDVYRVGFGLGRRGGVKPIR